MLAEFKTVDAARIYQSTPEWVALMAADKENSHNVMCISASNTRRIGPVDHADPEDKKRRVGIAGQEQEHGVTHGCCQGRDH